MGGRRSALAETILVLPSEVRVSYAELVDCMEDLLREDLAWVR